MAVLDVAGRVVDEGWATSDDELLGLLAEHDHGGAVVALDTPLVVTNPAGTSRACEVGLWWWAHGPAATLVAGDDGTGAILVPRPGRPG